MGGAASEGLDFLARGQEDVLVVGVDWMVTGNGVVESLLRDTLKKWNSLYDRSRQLYTAGKGVPEYRGCGKRTASRGATCSESAKSLGLVGNDRPG